MGRQWLIVISTLGASSCFLHLILFITILVNLFCFANID